MALLPVLLLVLAAISNSYHHPAIAAATERAPPELILLNLLGRDSDKASFAMQPHDLSLAGFANRTNHWHAFPGYEHIITDAATVLPFGNSYRDLIGGLQNLPSLPLGRDPALDAIHLVSSHDPAAADDDEVEALKRGLATLTVSQCEALRLKPVRDVLSQGWESGDAHLTQEHLGYIEHFDTICFELIRANRSGVWDGPFTDLLRTRANIDSLDDARDVVGVVVHRTFEQLLMAHARSA